MANYFLFALDSKPETLELMEQNASESLGGDISLLFQMHSHGYAIQKQAPEPVSIFLKGTQIGQFLGYHYDGNATGVNNIATPLIESGNVVFTIVDVRIEELASLKAGTLQKVIEGFVTSTDPDSALATGFNAAGENEKPFSTKPIFMNDTNDPVPLRVLKTWPFRQGEESKIEYYGGSPYNFEKGFQPTRLASQLQM